MAARLRRELHTEVDMVKARYGEFKVLVDGKVAVDGGSVAFLGILPPYQQILAEVRALLPVEIGSTRAAKSQVGA